MNPIQLVIFLTGVTGVILIGIGLWMIYPPVSLVTVGGTMAVWSWYVSVGIHLHQKPGGSN